MVVSCGIDHVVYSFTKERCISIHTVMRFREKNGGAWQRNGEFQEAVPGSLTSLFGHRKEESGADHGDEVCFISPSLMKIKQAHD